MARSGNGANGKKHATQQSLNGAIKSICDVMRRSNCAGAMQYVPELKWILFLRILDEREQQTKRKLLDECDLWCILSLPAGAFVNAGAGVKTNLLFFARGGPTEKIWYYDLSSVKVGKKTPLTLAHFEDFFARLPKREAGKRSWIVERAAIEAKNFDLKAVNPNVKSEEDTRTPEEILDLIEQKQKEIAEAISRLRAIS